MFKSKKNFWGIINNITYLRKNAYTEKSLFARICPFSQSQSTVTEFSISIVDN